MSDRPPASRLEPFTAEWRMQPGGRTGGSYPRADGRCSSGLTDGDRVRPSSASAMRPGEPVIGRDGGERCGSRIAVLLEPGRRGAAAVARAADLAAAPGRELTIIAVAPSVATVCRSCGGVSARAYNCAVRDDVAAELARAIDGLAGSGQPVNGQLLVQGADPPFERWVAEGGFDLVLLPSRRAVPRLRGHPAARSLRRQTDADIRVVRAPRRHAQARG